MTEGVASRKRPDRISSTDAVGSTLFLVKLARNRPRQAHLKTDSEKMFILSWITQETHAHAMAANIMSVSSCSRTAINGLLGGMSTAAGKRAL